MKSRLAARLSLLTLAAATLWTPLAVQPVVAQQVAFSTTIGMGSSSTLSKADFERMARILQMNADQKIAAEVLLTTYLAEHEKRAAELKAASDAAQAAFREDRDFSVFAELAPKQEAFAKVTADKERELLENVKGVLDAKQAERWPVWERSHRRAKSMARGMLAGERADLVQLVERLKLGDAAAKAVGPVLEAYEVELDRVLVLRAEAQRTAEQEGSAMRDLFGKGDGDLTEMMKKADELMKKAREASIPVRDCNRKYARQIEAAIIPVDAEAARKFAGEFRQASFPDVYRERYADRALAAAEGFEDLDKGQRDAVIALREQYQRDRQPLNEAAERAAEEAEANFSMGAMVSGGGVLRMMGGDEASQANRKARRELDTSTVDRLKAILSPSQVERLPSRASESSAEPSFGGVRVISPR